MQPRENLQQRLSESPGNIGQNFGILGKEEKGE
jgi:hypothetical protein